MEQKSTRGGARPGAGRKKGGKNAFSKKKGQRTTFQFRLSEQELESLKTRSAKEGMKPSELVRKVLFSPSDN